MTIHKSYKYIRLEKHLVTKVYRVLDMDPKERNEIEAKREEEGTVTALVMVGNMIYPKYQVETEEFDELQSVDEAGVNDG